jgi:hypothetical protein
LREYTIDRGEKGSRYSWSLDEKNKTGSLR